MSSTTWPQHGEPGSRRSRAPGGTVGSGIEEILVSALVIEVVAVSVREILGLREVSRRHATTLGLDESAADLLADALVGAVHLPGNPSDDGPS